MEKNEKGGPVQAAQKQILPTILQHEYTNNFRRVGSDLEKKCVSYDVSGRERVEWVRTTREAVKDFGVNIARLPYFDRYVIVPQNIDYKEVIGTCLNLYSKLPCVPEIGLFPTWRKLVSRIFREQEGKFWDYLTLLYRKPLQILPVLCLVSKENGTGKTTLANALSFIFGENVGIFGQDDLNSTFNVWIKKLVAVFEEISETKRSLNKIKSISTARNAVLNEKYRQQIQFRPFTKIVILSNSEETFITANEEDVRYWVVRPQPLKEEDFDPEFEEKLEREAPAVLAFLASRTIETPCRSRMWFSPKDIETDALAVVRKESRSPAAKEIELWAEDTGENLFVTEGEIYEALGMKYSRAEIRKALKEELKMDNPQTRYKDRYGALKNGKPYFFPYGEDLPE